MVHPGTVSSSGRTHPYESLNVRVIHQTKLPTSIAPQFSSDTYYLTHYAKNLCYVEYAAY